MYSLPAKILAKAKRKCIELTVEFECFCPNFKVFDKKDGGTYQKAFLNLDGFPLSIIDFSGVVVSSGVLPHKPCTIRGSLKKSDYKGSPSYTVFIQDIYKFES